MRALLLEPDPEWLAERRRLGHDRFDEVWDGVLHVVPSPSAPHQRFESRLERVLWPLVEPLGLEIFHNFDLLDRKKGEDDYRQPDIAVVSPSDVTHAIEVYALTGEAYQLVAAGADGAITAPRFGLRLSVVDGPRLRVAWADGHADM